MFNLTTDETILSLTNHLSSLSSILMKNTDNKSVNSLNIYCSNALPFYLYTSRSARLDTFIRIQRKPMEHTRRLKNSLFHGYMRPPLFPILIHLLLGREYPWLLQHVPLGLIVLRAQTHSFPPINVAALLQTAPPGSSFPFAWDLFPIRWKKTLYEMTESGCHDNRQHQNPIKWNFLPLQQSIEELPLPLHFLNFKRTLARLSHSFWHLHAAS